MKDSGTEPERVRQWLAATIDGEAPAWPFEAAADTFTLTATIRREAVATLIEARLAAAANSVPDAVRRSITDEARRETALILYQTHRCRTLLADLAAAAIPLLLLKGSAVAHWAYAAPNLRQRGDIDLLFASRAAADAALAVLARHGFVAREAALPGDLVCFELTAVSADPALPALEIDIHWRLSSVPMFAFRFDWDELVASSIALPALAPTARGLGPVPAWLHAAMHRAQNRGGGVRDTLKWLYDLVVIGRRLAPDDWRALAAAAISRGLAGICLDAADAAARWFADPMPASTRSTLAAAARTETLDPARLDQWWYQQRMNLAAIPGPRLKLRWLRQRLFPDRAYRHQRYGDAGATRTRLAAMLRRLGQR